MKRGLRTVTTVFNVVIVRLHVRLEIHISLEISYVQVRHKGIST
jgi:hypothetical protein